jgi:serine O-acetyltransferase
VELQAPSSLRELWEYAHEDYEMHERDLSRPGFRALLVYRFGNWRMHVRKPWRAGFSLLYRSMFRYVRNHYGVEIPFSAKIGRRVVIEHQGGIVIHGCSVIGDDCVIRQGVTLGNRYMHSPFDAPVLGQRVNVGAGAKLLGGIQVGDDASIGANSVVLKDVPAGGTAVGIPARLLADPALPKPNGIPNPRAPKRV